MKFKPHCSICLLPLPYRRNMWGKHNIFYKICIYKDRDTGVASSSAGIDGDAVDILDLVLSERGGWKDGAQLSPCLCLPASVPPPRFVWGRCQQPQKNMTLWNTPFSLGFQSGVRNVNDDSFMETEEEVENVQTTWMLGFFFLKHFVFCDLYYHHNTVIPK